MGHCPGGRFPSLYREIGRRYGNERLGKKHRWFGGYHYYRYGNADHNFIDAIRREKPTPSEIVHIKVDDMPDQSFYGFSIIDSAEGGDDAAMIPADLAICPDCLADLYDTSNPRYRHPFISCMACGPRYTIIDRIPYDRCNTAMDDFPMCDFCKGEYTDRRDRRYHAQTISCHHCGPELLLYGSDLRGDGAVREAAKVIKSRESNCLERRRGDIILWRLLLTERRCKTFAN